MDDFLDFYDLLGVEPGSSVDVIEVAIREQRRVWHKRQDASDFARRLLAQERVRQVDLASRVLTDPTERRRYDTEREAWLSDPRAASGAYSGRAAGQQAQRDAGPPAPPLPPPPPNAPPPPPGALPPPVQRVELMKVISYSNQIQYPSPICPALDSTGAPLLNASERIQAHLEGYSFSGYSAWDGAPGQILFEVPGITRLLLTGERAMFLAYNYVAVQGKEYGLSATTITGDIFGALASSASRSRAQSASARAVAGTALGGQIPYTLLASVSVHVDYGEGAPIGTIALRMGHGEAQYTIGIQIPGQPIEHLRSTCQWLAQTAVYHRRVAMGDLYLSAELDELDAFVANGRPEMRPDGEVLWVLPQWLDASEILDGRPPPPTNVQSLLPPPPPPLQ